MAKPKITYESLMRELKSKAYKPIYCLMGDEPYYIDKISHYISEKILTASEKEFNQTIAYGSDVNVADIINMAKRYPMMSEYQVILIKEAQQLDRIDDLVYYLQQPQTSTILVLCFKNKTLDRRKKVTAAIEKAGVIFDSQKLKEGKLPSFIADYLKKNQIGIDSQSATLIASFIGNDLSRLTSELDKLIIAMPQGKRNVTPELIEENIGISKDFNVFELKTAIIQKDVYKVNQIVNYFYSNSKSHPIQPVLALLFSFFSNLMLAYYSPEKSEEGIAKFLDLRYSWQVKEYIVAMNKYSAFKVMNIISYLREYDAKSKGVGGNNFSDEALYKELMYKILH
jgi:DNA polymerase-3 subunit delta